MGNSNASQWSGYYLQGGIQHPMNFSNLKISQDGSIVGNGYDGIGAFTVHGRIVKTPTSDVQLVKNYVQRHNVLYAGKITEQNGTTIVNGHWEIFHEMGGMSEGFQVASVPSHN